jgi:hypothetical protein
MADPVLPYVVEDPLTQHSLEDLASWGASQVFQRSHLDVTTWAVTNIASGAFQDITVTFGVAFDPNVTPVVMLAINSTQTTLTDFSDNCTAVAYNRSNSGCTVRVKNQGGSTLGSGTVKLIVTAIDPTFIS